MYAYVGSRTTRERNARGDGISVFRVDSATGALEHTQLVKDLVNPSFLAMNRAGDRLYTVHGDLSDISAFAVDRASGKLEFINRQSTQGKNPVHLAIDPSGRHVVVSNHIGASLAVLPLNADGSLGELTQLVKLDGPIGPHRVEQKQAKPHFNPFDPTGQFVIVPDKGLDRTFTFRFADGKLSPAAPAFVGAREGAGPRHVAFHPGGRFAYVINELDSTVTAYSYDAASGALTPMRSCRASRTRSRATAVRRRSRSTPAAATPTRPTAGTTAWRCSRSTRAPGICASWAPIRRRAARRASSPQHRMAASCTY